ncbi:LuxR C-terminal-related transcriptional regulator [Streptomyces sp. SAI-124]|uniref:LuxR C-terminal-related transcriptional regulator n=1 Tax=Streptomyces sp. SAI-124 TaxID=3377730 RepID=UPI003C79E54C
MFRGRGFDPEAVHGGYGLSGLGARVTEGGGTTEVGSAPGEGTTITLRLPVTFPRSCRPEAPAAELRPDIVLMDLRMPGGGGVESIVRMSEAGLPCRVVVLTTCETDRDILRAVEAGAAGHLLKDLPRGRLAEAVRRAARGETVPAPSVAARLVDQLRTRPERPRLSSRETAVLRLVAEGCTNAGIGRGLFIGESTVKTHLLRVFAELGVADRTAAVTSAMRYGLLD